MHVAYRKRHAELYWLTFFFFSHTFTFQLLDKPWSQVSSLLPPLLLLAFNFYRAHRFQQSHCSSIFHRVLLTHALALSASHSVHKKKSQRLYTVCTRRGLRNWPIPGSRISWYATGATGLQQTDSRSRGEVFATPSIRRWYTSLLLCYFIRFTPVTSLLGGITHRYISYGLGLGLGLGLALGVVPSIVKITIWHPIGIRGGGCPFSQGS